VLLVLALLVQVLARGRMQPLRGDGFRIVGIGAAVALAWSAHRPLHVVVTLVALAALILYIVLFSLRLA
jgi:hypothetical protein